jgi:hypothetical protein
MKEKHRAASAPFDDRFASTVLRHRDSEKRGNSSEEELTVRNGKQTLTPPKVLRPILGVSLLAPDGADDAEDEVDGGEGDVIGSGEICREGPGPDLLVFDDEGGPVEDRESYARRW